MGRFSPTVLPQGGQIFANALEGGVDTFLQARRQKLAQEDTMLGRGYRPQTDADKEDTSIGQVANVPGAVTPTPAPAQPPVASSMQEAMNFSRTPGTNGNAPVDPALMHAALAQHVQSGAPLTAPTALTSPDQLAPPHSRAITVGGRQWVLTDEGEASKQAALADALGKADLYKAQAGFYNARPGMAAATNDTRRYVADTGADARRDVADTGADARRDVAGTNAGARVRAAEIRGPGASATPGGEHPVTGTSRLNAIQRAAARYMAPSWKGGAGMKAADAITAATQEVDGMIGGSRAPLLSRPAGPSVVQPQQGKGPAGDVALDPVEAAVQHLRAGTGTIDQLKASNKSPAFKAAVLARLQGGPGAR